MKNLFIVFEGIDGSGTSTQAALLKEYFLQIGLSATLTSEPSDGPIGQLIKSGMKRRLLFTNNKKNFDYQMSYLFAADRHDHLYNEVDGVIKLLESYIVISTRYYFSSLAYHCNNEEEYNFVKSLNSRFPDPDLVIYIDNPIDVSVERMKTRSVTEVYENKEKLKKVKINYDKFFSNYEGNLLVVKGNEDIDKINQEITNYIEKVYTGRCWK